MKKIGLFLLLYSLLLSACDFSPDKQATPDYEQNKKMIVDILKSDEGKKAIQEIFSDNETKVKLIMDDETVRKAIEDALQSDKGTDFWKKAFADSDFIQALSKGMKSEHKKILKELMKDPEYQELVVHLLKDPEVEEQMTQLLKSKDFNKHLQSTIIETVETPLFQAKLEKALQKAIDQMNSGQNNSENSNSNKNNNNQDQQQGQGQTIR